MIPRAVENNYIFKVVRKINTPQYISGVEELQFEIKM
jgi:hypothetical protein